MNVKQERRCQSTKDKKAHLAAMMYRAKAIVMIRSLTVLSKLQKEAKQGMTFHAHQLNFLKMLRSNNRAKYYNQRRKIPIKVR